MRPSELATDEASSIDVIDHAINWVESHDSEKYEYICLLEPSSPFATADDLDKALESIISSCADTLLGMKEAEVNSRFVHPLDKYGKLSHFYHSISENPVLDRQSQEKEYTMNGCMYIARWDYYIKNHILHSVNSIPYIMDSMHSIEIDEMIDFEFAVFCVEHGYIDTSAWK